MLQVETTQIFDATKYLGCGTCLFNFNCRSYELICELVHSKSYFGSRLLCAVEHSHHYGCMALNYAVYNCHDNNFKRAQNAFKQCLPLLNNWYTAFLKYECEIMSEYEQRAIYIALASELESWGLLKDFDYFFSHDLENTYNMLLERQEWEMSKPENQTDANASVKKN